MEMLKFGKSRSYNKFSMPSIESTGISHVLQKVMYTVYLIVHVAMRKRGEVATDKNLLIHRHGTVNIKSE